MRVQEDLHNQTHFGEQRQYVQLVMIIDYSFIHYDCHDDVIGILRESTRTNTQQEL